MKPVRLVVAGIVLALVPGLLLGCTKASESPSSESPTGTSAPAEEPSATPAAPATEADLPQSGTGPITWDDVLAAPPGSAESFLGMVLEMSYGPEASAQMQGATAEYGMEYSNRIVTVVIGGKPAFAASHNSVGEIQAWSFRDLTLPQSENAGSPVDYPDERLDAIDAIVQQMAAEMDLPADRIEALLAVGVESATTSNGMRMRVLDDGETTPDSWNVWFAADGRVEVFDLGFGGN